jgi:hypothetical protein
MALTIPVSTNYPDLLTPVPAVWNKTPIEGVKHIGGSINWGTMGGSGKTVSMNVGGNAAAPISHIAAISVDNSQSGADVIVMFPDSGQTIPVPAYQAGTFPVFTTGTQFYMSAPNSLSVDKTTFVVHNAVPPHSNVPKTEFQNVTVVSALTMANGTSQVIPATVTGSLAGLVIGAINLGTVPFSASMTMKDGTGATIWRADAAGAAQLTQILTDQTGMQVRFSQGITATIAITGAPNGEFNINLLYRTP